MLLDYYIERTILIIDHKEKNILKMPIQLLKAVR